MRRTGRQGQEYVETAAKMAGDDGYVGVRRAFVLSKVLRPDIAVTTVRQYEESHAKSGSDYQSFGIFENLESYQDARRAYQRALELEPELVDGHKDLGDVFQKLGDSNGAAKQYEEEKVPRTPAPDSRVEARQCEALVKLRGLHR